jgi:hypothetical protein
VSASDRTEHDPDALRHAHEALRRFSAEAVTRDTTTGDSGQTGGVPPEVQPLVGHPTGAGARYGPRGLLGRGGGGEVWEVDDLALGRAVAVKVQLAGGGSGNERQARFAGEAATTATLEHPGILPVYDIGRTSDGRLWFSMRRASGTTLSDAIAGLARGGPSPLTALADRVQVLVQVCDAVAYAHSRGVIHRDLKPGNIMLGAYGEVLVLDWGTAVRSGTTGRAVGTPMYMAPEQARGERVDERTDVYGLGATLWHLVTLQPPCDTETEPERFWEAKRAGRLLPLPPEVEVQIPGDLLAIVHQALDPDPARRLPGAAALREALRGWLRGRDAAALREVAERRLRELAQRGDHRGFAQVEEDLGRAAALAPDDVRIQAAQRAARTAHARFAIDRGELDLAGELADPADAGLQRLLSGARRRRRLRQGWLAALGVLAAIGLIVAGWTVWSDHRARLGVWQTVWERDFTKPGASLAGVSGNFLNIPLTTEGMLLETSHLLWLEGVAETGDVRVRATVRWPHQVDGFEIHVGVDDHALPNFEYSRPIGVGCQFGGWLGTRSIVGVSRAIGDSTLDATGWYPQLMDPERTYAVEMERRGAMVRLRLDGQLVLEHEVLLPPQGDACRRVAIRSWGPVAVRQLSVERLGLPRRGSPLVVGEAFLTAGQPDRATQAFRRVAEDLPDDPLGEQALALAINAACRDPASVAADRRALLAELRQRAPRSPFLASAAEMLILRDWSDGRTEAAMAEAEAVVDAIPDTRLVQRMVNPIPPRLTQAQLERLLRLVRRAQGVHELSLRNQPIADLAPLAGLPLHELVLSGTQVEDLTPLAGMPLRILDLADTAVRDLRPLQGMQLSELNIQGADVSDLTPITGMPLRRLTLAYSKVRDLAVLRGMRLVALSLNGMDLDRLPEFDVSGLLNLLIADTRIADLSPLAGSPMRALDASRAPLRDLMPLAACRGLRRLTLMETQVVDLRPLAGLSLVFLRLNRTPVSDLAPIAGMPLDELDLSSTQVTDLGPLRHGRLRQLTATGLDLADLTPLAQCPIEVLRLSGSRVRDLTPVATARLEELDLGATAADPAPLRACPRLRLVTVHPEAAVRPAWVALAATWSEEGRHGLADGLRMQLAFQSGDAATLRSYAQPLPGGSWLWVAGRYRADEALALAEAVGARLLRIAGPETEARLMRSPWPITDGWLGVVDQGALGWTHDDGSPIAWNGLRDRQAPPPGRLRACLSLLSGRATWHVQAADNPSATLPVFLEWPGGAAR